MPRYIAAGRLSFEHDVEMDMVQSIHLVDSRKEYGEERRIAVGYIEQRLHVVCYTLRGRAMHIISLRKANIKEAKRYGKPQKTAH